MNDYITSIPKTLLTILLFEAEDPGRPVQQRDGWVRVRGRSVRRQQEAGEGQQRRHRGGHWGLLGHHRGGARVRAFVSQHTWAKLN